MGINASDLLKELREGLTLDGRKRVFEYQQKLSSQFLKERSDPEAFTKEVLIDPILREFNLKKLPEKHFKGIRGDFRKVDYHLRNEQGIPFIAEAKAFNADLFERSENGAVNQIKGLFRLAEVKDKYQFGIATDGLKWIFIDRNGAVAYNLNLISDFDSIKTILIGEREVKSEKEEEISKKFYDWYNALLHGGKYKNHDNKIRTISENDCLVENIFFVSNQEDKEYIAQTVMDRLIFIKFLQSKGIISYDVLDYLKKLDADVLNDKLRQLFFSVLNAETDIRLNIDSHFRGIPYLNGSLFVRTKAEARNPDYKIEAYILREILNFLDSFSFLHSEGVITEKTIDPEILGYIFERAMTAKDRKGSGAYYTPKAVTRYIAEHTIHPIVLDRANKLLKNKGYKDSELLKGLPEIFRLRESTLEDVFEIVLDLKVCDPACGSGAFLLAAADVLLEIYKQINDELRLRNSEVALRKLILKNNLHGVDINLNAVEIAKLRLWLWLVSAYDPKKVEPLPNIDYETGVGNSLVGYRDISKFQERSITLLDWSEESLNLLLMKKQELISTYKEAFGEEAHELKRKVEAINERIRTDLDATLHREFETAGINISRDEFKSLKPFYWGFEFSDIFDHKKAREDKGFDVIIGNPPYVFARGKKFDEQIKKHYYDAYDLVQYQLNTFVMFIEQSFKLLKTGGFLGFVLSNTWITIETFSELRKFLLEKTGDLQIINIFDRVFQDAHVDTCLLVFKKGIPTKVTLGEFQDGSLQLVGEFLPSFFASNKYIINIALAKNTDQLLILEKINRSSKPLKEFAAVRVGLKAYQVGKGKPKQTDEIKTNRVFHSQSKLNESYFRYLDGRDVRRYSISWGGWWLSYGEHLAEPRNLRLFTAPRILVRQIPSLPPHSINAAYTDKPLLNDLNSMVVYDFVNVNSLYILAVLNSRATTFWFVHTFDKFQRRTFPQFKVKELAIFPIPNAVDSCQELLANKVRTISTLLSDLQNLEKDTQQYDQILAEIRSLDLQIDKQIYDLFGLTEEEIKIIETE